MRAICFHGAESTGKSTLARAMAVRFGCPWVPEYGREYCETRGTNLTMDDLLAIARGQDEARKLAIQQAAAASPPLLLLDTDPLMTAAWARMLFGEVPDELLGYPKADLYLAFAADVSWVSDGTRLFGTDARRELFAAIAADMLVRGCVPFVDVSGGWAARERTVLEVLAAQALAAQALAAQAGTAQAETAITI